MVARYLFIWNIEKSITTSVIASEVTTSVAISNTDHQRNEIASSEALLAMTSTLHTNPFSMTIINKQLRGRNILIGLLTVTLVVIIAFSFATSIEAQDGIGKIKTGISDVAGPTGLKVGGDVADEKAVLEIIGKIVNVLLSFLGAGFLVLVLYAGGIWMFAMGDPKKVDKAKGIIKTASIGIAVIVLSFFIVNLVLSIVGQVSGGGAGPGGTPTCNLKSGLSSCGNDADCVGSAGCICNIASGACHL